MREIIDADLPFHLKTIRTIDAAVLFRERGMNDKARLIESAGMLIRLITNWMATSIISMAA
mgnify:CR=1 FL=1